MPTASTYSISFSQDAINRGCRTARLTYFVGRQRKSVSLRADRPTIVSANDTELLDAVRAKRLDWTNGASPFKFTIELAVEAEKRTLAEKAQKERLAEADRSPHVAGSLAEAPKEARAKTAAKAPAESSPKKAKTKPAQKSAPAQGDGS